MLWIKALHLVALISWYAGLFYLPRLFVYHAMTEDTPGLERFKIMERKLYFYIMTPAMLVTLATGLTMLFGYVWDMKKNAGWFHIKLTCVVLLVAFHHYCGYLMKQFKKDKGTHSHVFYRYLNEIPTVLLIVIMIAVYVQP